MNDRHAQIRPPESSTLQWIYEHRADWGSWTTRPEDSFPIWLRSNSRVYWIKGKPGSGKSVLIAYLAEDNRTRQALAEWSMGSKCHILTYYATAVGSKLQCNIQGLLRCLLFQLYRLEPGIFPPLISRFSVDLDEPLAWTDDQLFQVLTEALGATQFSTCIFIDGLDEFREGIEGFSRVVSMLSNYERVKVCLSSRHYPTISLGNYPGLVMENHNHNDIAGYAENTLLRVSRANNWPDDSAVKTISKTAADRSEGVFLWTKLTIEVLIRRILSGSSITDLREILDSIPIGLDHWYESLISSISSSLVQQEALDILLLLRYETGASLPVPFLRIIRHLPPILQTPSLLMTSNISVLRELAYHFNLVNVQLDKETFDRQFESILFLNGNNIWHSSIQVCHTSILDRVERRFSVTSAWSEERKALEALFVGYLLTIQAENFMVTQGTFANDQDRHETSSETHCHRIILFYASSWRAGVRLINLTPRDDYGRLEEILRYGIHVGMLLTGDVRFEENIGTVEDISTDMSSVLVKLQTNHDEPATYPKMNHGTIPLSSPGTNEQARMNTGDLTEVFMPALDNQDYEWEFSDTASLASGHYTQPESVASASTASSFMEESDLSEHLAYSLVKNGELRSLYEKALQRLGSELFPSSHDKILVAYLADLRNCVTSRLEVEAIASVSGKRQRREVTKIVTRLIKPRGGSDFSKLEQENEGRIARLNKRLQELESRLIQKTTSSSKLEVVVEKAVSDPQNRYEMTTVTPQNTSKERLPMASISALFLTGQAFRKLKARLSYLLDTPADISEALASNNPDTVSLFLENQFDEAVTGELKWIEDLVNMDYSYDEVAKLLYEAHHDSPWIFFDANQPMSTASYQIRHEFHLEGCAHHLLHDEQFRKEAKRSPGPPESIDTEQPDLETLLEELCGLGGVVPASRSKSDWEGSITFDEQDPSLAMISYANPSDLDPSVTHTWSRLRRIIKRLSAAIGYYQNAGYCCNSFTILTASRPNKGQEDAQIKIDCIEFTLASDVDQCCETLMAAAEGSDSWALALKRLHQTSAMILNRISPDNMLAYSDSDTSNPQTMDVVNKSSLAVQGLCLGFLLYTKVHAGEVQPFFIDRPIHEFKLLGIGSAESEGTLGAREFHLTCLGEMTQGPVMAFYAGRGWQKETSSLRLDVVSTPENILDTWGPGALIYSRHQTPVPFGIMIGGGYICPALSGGAAMKYHWSQDIDPPSVPLPLHPGKPILVGSIVRKNNVCRNDEVSCWRACSNSMEEVGTYRDYMEKAEYQFGLQGGPDHIAFLANIVMAKQRGATRKSKLQSVHQLLVSYLDCFWGVRVSYCTGIAQRVLLRQLIAELFPVFAELRKSPTEKGLWSTLNAAPHHIITKFEAEYDHRGGGETIVNYLRDLPKDLYDFTLGIITQILGTLSDTGISPDGSFFHIVWPCYPMVTLGFRVPVTEDCTKWLPILEDSDSCITFAYMTKDCLEAGNILCRGANTLWAHEMPLIETAVLCPAMPQRWTIQQQGFYFFTKLDGSLVFVKAEQYTINQAQTGIILVKQPASKIRSLHGNIRSRFIAEQRNKGRIKERFLHFQQAQAVSILSRRLT